MELSIIKLTLLTNDMKILLSMSINNEKKCDFACPCGKFISQTFC